MKKKYLLVTHLILGAAIQAADSITDLSLITHSTPDNSQENFRYYAEQTSGIQYEAFLNLSNKDDNNAREEIEIVKTNLRGLYKTNKIAETAGLCFTLAVLSSYASEMLAPDNSNYPNGILAISAGVTPFCRCLKNITSLLIDGVYQKDVEYTRILYPHDEQYSNVKKLILSTHTYSHNSKKRLADLLDH